MQVDAVVIGAGVVGLATARELARAGDEVLVLERARHVGSETSSRNSEVIHSGIYYAPDSLKARTCVLGRELLYAYCAARDVPHRRTGKFIVAVDAAESATLTGYAEKARANGVGSLERLTGDQVRLREPQVVCCDALYSPYTGIVDSHALMLALWGDLQHAGGDVVFDSDVAHARVVQSAGFEITLASGDSLRCNRLVNCAGHGAVPIAREIGAAPGYSLPEVHFARGHYFGLSGRAPFRHLVYPVAERGGLGIHVTLDLGGRVRFGPDVEWCSGLDYAFDESRRERFAAAIRRYYPELDSTRLVPDYVGVRPKIAGPDQPAADFRIDGPVHHGIAGLVHLFGIESPGLTACLAIAQYVRDLLDRGS